MNKIYQIATLNERIYPTIEQLEQSELYAGQYHGIGRECLQGAPILSGLYGPMYNGTDENGNVIIRYESKEMYLTFD